MILSCPECSARFVVKPEAIGQAGRKVKCTKCKHIWFEEGKVEYALEQAAELAEEKAEEFPKRRHHLPKVQEEEPFPVVPAVSFATMLVLTIITLFLVNAQSMINSNSFMWFYSAFGGYNTEGINLNDVEIEKTGLGKNKDLLLSGVISNNTKLEKTVPALRVAIIDKQGNVLRTVVLASEGAVMLPDEKIDFNNKIPYVPESADKIVMDLGSPLELFFR